MTDVPDPARPTIWPAPSEPATAHRLAAAGAAGLAVTTLAPSRPGVNVPLIGLALAAAVLPLARASRTGGAFAVSALALLTLPVFRDAGWLTALVILLAVPLATFAITGGRRWVELVGGGLALPLAARRALPWSGRAVTALARSGRGPTTGPLIRSVLIAAALLVVFGFLFAQADAAFSRALGELMPELSAGSLVLHLVVAAAAGGVVLTMSYLALAKPRFEHLATMSRRPAARTVWAIPLAALDLLFLAFAVFQADVLVATDKERLLRGTGLTYAEYARQGFWQLSIVTVLVLAVVAVAVHLAPLRSTGDRALVRGLLGALCVLTLVVVAVALRRLYLYEEAYGWTRLRLWVHAFELWLGLVIVLVLFAGIRFGVAWLPRAVALTGAAGLLTLGALDPDGFIAERNVDRYLRTGKADLTYLSSLSADAVPALSRLPEPQRSCVLRPLARELGGQDAWASSNMSRRRARAVLSRTDLAAFPDRC